MTLAENEKKKILVSNFIPTWPGQEISNKNRKKIKKHHSDIISIQTMMR